MSVTLHIDLYWQANSVLELDRREIFVVTWTSTFLFSLLDHIWVTHTGKVQYNARLAWHQYHLALLNGVDLVISILIVFVRPRDAY